MVALAIALLWFLIGVIILAAIIWFVLYGLKTVAGLPIPARIEQGIWFVFLILVIIYLLTTLVGGGGGFSLPHMR